MHRGPRQPARRRSRRSIDSDRCHFSVCHRMGPQTRCRGWSMCTTQPTSGPMTVRAGTEQQPSSFGTIRYTPTGLELIREYHSLHLFKCGREWPHHGMAPSHPLDVYGRARVIEIFGSGRPVRVGAPWSDRPEHTLTRRKHRSSSTVSSASASFPCFESDPATSR